MHSSFTFNPNTNRSSSNYQQQPIYNIGAPPAFTQTFVTHRQPNLFLNHHAFTRSFASVVSCDSNLGKHQNMNADNNSGIFGSFFKHFKQQTTPQYHHPTPHIPPAQSQNKEFEDFTHMPSVNNRHTYNPHIYQQPPTHHIKVESSSQQQQQVNNNNNLSYAAATTNFMASLFVGCQPRQGPARPRKPWFNKGFRCRGGRWGGKHQYNPKFNPHDVKHSHEKERSSIERDIQDDSCDFVHIIEDKDVKMTRNSPNETAKGSCYSKPSDDPPFMIYSLEDFPAINSTVKKQTAVGKKQPSPSKSDEGFVVVPTEASISTPSFTPKRISLCEKFIKSPTKMFPKPMLPMILKPCLKVPRRRVSECSDDFIVFANDDCENDQDAEEDDDVVSDDGSETDSESDDDIFEEDEESTSEEESDEEEDEGTSEQPEVDECDNKRSETPQADSGVEERRVHFNLKPKVHVMRVWDYAYRAYRLEGDYWLQMSRDRDRFKKRIKEQQKVLSPILNDKHREKIFRERFQ